MPLRDHFRPPLSRQRLWHGFHNSWATYLSADVNRQLPRGWFAQANVQFNIEIDVAAFEEDEASGERSSSWAPPEPALLAPMAILTDVVEVQVFAGSGGPALVGAVELVSPANKDRPGHREAFVTKCAAMLQQGIGVVIVDVVTERRASLHAALIGRLSPSHAVFDADLYATAYRPVTRGDDVLLAVWQHALGLGEPLSDVPLFLRGGPCVRLGLEESYERTWLEQGMPTNGALAAT